MYQKRCRDGVICAVFVCPVSTPSFCGFWHCHPYIPLHFWFTCFMYTFMQVCVCVCLFIYSYLHISPTQCFISLNTLDFDECASENSNGCQQNCSNTEGSYTCSCNVGYTLDEDGYTCNGKICIIVLLLIILYLYVYDKCEDGVPCFVCVSIC